MPWELVTGTSVVDGGGVKLWWRKGPDEDHKELCTIPYSEWNGRLLPHIIERLMPPQS